LRILSELDTYYASVFSSIVFSAIIIIYVFLLKTPKVIFSLLKIVNFPWGVFQFIVEVILKELQ